MQPNGRDLGIDPKGILVTKILKNVVLYIFYSISVASSYALFCSYQFCKFYMKRPYKHRNHTLQILFYIHIFLIIHQNYILYIQYYTYQIMESKSFIKIPENSHFTYDNLPFGIFSTESNVRKQRFNAKIINNYNYSSYRKRSVQVLLLVKKFSI